MVWVSSYPPGVPANIDDNAYQNLVQFFVETLDQHASKIAFE